MSALNIAENHVVALLKVSEAVIAQSSTSAAIDDTQILASLKLQELKRSLESLVLRFEHERLRSIGIVKLLVEDLNESRSGYLNVYKNFVSNLKIIQQRHMTQSQWMVEVALQQLNSLENSISRDIINIHSIEMPILNQLTSVREVMQSHEASLEESVKSEERGEYESIRNHDVESTFQMKNSLETRVRTLFNNAKSQLDYFNSAVNESFQEYKQLLIRNKRISRDVHIRFIALKKNNKAIQAWKSKIELAKNEWEKRNKTLQEDQGVLDKQILTRKQSTEEAQKECQNRFALMSVCSRSALISLEEQIDFGKKILLRYERAPKVEEHLTEIDDTENSSTHNFSKFTKFAQLVAKCEADNSLLQARYVALLEERDELDNEIQAKKDHGLLGPLCKYNI